MIALTSHEWFLVGITAVLTVALYVPVTLLFARHVTGEWLTWEMRRTWPWVLAQTLAAAVTVLAISRTLWFLWAFAWLAIVQMGPRHGRAMRALMALRHEYERPEEKVRKRPPTT